MANNSTLLASSGVGSCLDKGGLKLSAITSRHSINAHYKYSHMHCDLQKKVGGSSPVLPMPLLDT